MLTLGGLFLIMVVIGFAILSVKLIVALFLIPLKLGLGLVKLLIGILIGIPLLILGLTVAVVAIPTLIVAIPVLILLGLIVAPFAIAGKIFF